MAPGAMCYVEDLTPLALEWYRLSRSLCRSFDDFRTSWPYLRIARASSAVKAGAQTRASWPGELFADGDKRIAIAGAGDADLLALVARSFKGRAAEIVAIDRCATPLRLCIDFAERWLLPLETLQLGLVNFEIAGRFDIVLVHSLLAFISAECRIDVLWRPRRSLRREGQLVIKFNTGRPIADARPGYRYAEAIVKELEGPGVSLPESRETFLSRLDVFGSTQAARDVAFENFHDVEELLEAARYIVGERTHIESNRTEAFGYRGDVARQGYFAVARSAGPA